MVKIIKAVGVLSDNPIIGRAGRIYDTRELIVSGTPFIVLYRVKLQKIEIIRIFHGAMKWPDFL